jgi:predicted site-specific integrase-resolvase
MRARLQIGEVVALLGVTPKAIRHYHKRGLLAEPTRSEGGYRLYTASVSGTTCRQRPNRNAPGSPLYWKNIVRPTQ